MSSLLLSSPLLLLLLFLLLLTSGTGQQQHSKKCKDALACRGDWLGFAPFQFLPTAVDHPVPRDFSSYLNVDNLLKRDITWIVMIGDSNTRYLFFKLVEYLCTVDVECSQYIPFYHVSTKKKGSTTFPEEKPILDLVDDSFRAAHQDHDIYVQSCKNASAPQLRLSFRMTVGKFSKTLRSMDDMEHLYCLYRVPPSDFSYEARFLDRCEEGFKAELSPVLQLHQKRYAKNRLHPDVLLMSFGYWDLRGLLNDTMNDIFFKKLGDIEKRTRTRVIWLTNYRFRADIIKGYNREHWNSFKNVGDLTTLIQDTNKVNIKRAQTYHLDIMDVDRMSERLEAYYNTTFVNTYEYKTATRDMQILKKRQFLTWDGVHQTSSFYSAMLYEVSLVLLECRKLDKRL